jgi:hypothetical protein
MLRVGVSAPDIAGADESNPHAPESFLSTVAYFGQYPNSNGTWITGLPSQPSRFARCPLLDSGRQPKRTGESRKPGK